LVRVEGVSKKFCRSLKKSLWYGVCDIAGELLPGRKRELQRTELTTKHTNFHEMGTAGEIEDPGTVRKSDFGEMPWYNQGAGLREETASMPGADWA
jgi:hypothetical protein